MKARADGLEQSKGHKQLVACLAVATLFFVAAITKAEDGYRLWLRYDSLPSRMIGTYRLRAASIVVPGKSATLDAIRGELANGCAGLLGNAVPIVTEVDRDGAIVVGTPKSLPLIAGLNWERQLAALGPEGF